MSEEAIQQAVVQWMTLAHPAEAWMLHHSPNGGQRSAIVGAKLKAAGTRRGFPDLIFPQHRGPFAGLVLELKAPGGRPTPEQLRWLEAFAAEGWHASVAVGLEAAIQTIQSYMEMPHGRAA